MSRRDDEAVSVRINRRGRIVDGADIRTDDLGVGHAVYFISRNLITLAE